MTATRTNLFDLTRSGLESFTAQVDDLCMREEFCKRMSNKLINLTCPLTPADDQCNRNIRGKSGQFVSSFLIGIF